MSPEEEALSSPVEVPGSEPSPLTHLPTHLSKILFILNSSPSLTCPPVFKFCVVVFILNCNFRDSLVDLRCLQSRLVPDSSALDDWKSDLRLYQGMVPGADDPKRLPSHKYLAPGQVATGLLVGNRGLKIPVLYPSPIFHPGHWCLCHTLQ